MRYSEESQTYLTLIYNSKRHVISMKYVSWKLYKRK